MRILVTGGLGAVGVPLTERLRANGHEVWVVDRPHHHGHPGTHYVRGDVGEYRQMEAVFERAEFDFVYHAAAEFGRNNGEDFYETMWRSNAVGTKNMLRLQEQRRFRMVVFSSSEIYGDYDGVMSEDVSDRVALKQMNDYAISKWVNELQTMNSAAVHGTESVIVRLFNTYGPGEPYSEYRSVICKFIYCALHDLPYTVYLNHTRTSTYIDDTARTLSAICDNFKAGAVYNIAGQHHHDIKSVSDLILRTCGKTDQLVRYIEGEPHNTKDKRASAKPAERDLGHRETVSLEDGIARTVAWQKDYYRVGR